jgi:hypothetical protein
MEKAILGEGKPINCCNHLAAGSGQQTVQLSVICY